MDSPAVGRVLAEIAEVASETLELQDVFERVATAVRTVIPFENMGVVRLVEGQRALLHATTLSEMHCFTSCSEPMPLTVWSPRLRPRPGPVARIDDAQAELDPSFPADADILSKGIRSALWAPFRSASGFAGGVWLSASQPGAFQDRHQEILRPIAALLGSAVEHWRIWDAERRRRERLDRLEALLGSLAESLDVREVFEALSAAVQPVLTHHLLVLTEIDEDARTFRLLAHAGESDAPAPEGDLTLTEAESGNRLLDFQILDDLPADLRPDTQRNRALRDTGMRSWLRVPVRLWGEVRGSLGFLHREPSFYREADVEVAHRLADRIALGMCHHRLAEEARATAAERERAERLEATVATLAAELEAKGRVRVIGRSPSWKAVLTRVGRVAAAETTVLITGETGTGKEVVARLVHQGSPRAGKPFVALNCAALPEQLLESELFGHEKGAFTGALSAKIGRLEQAAGGTLFLDEVGEMSPLVQAKLLRVLQEREFQRLGGSRTLRADVRVLAATNRDLAAALARGEFREDLYYRLNVFEIGIPPLRERPEDILPLAEAFLQELGPTVGRPAAGISRDAREWLRQYPWRGNVRELRNAIERAMLLCDGGLITREHLPAMTTQSGAPAARNGDPAPSSGPSLDEGGVDLGTVERQLIQRALQQARGNKSQASRLLGLTRAQFYSRLDKYGLR